MPDAYLNGRYVVSEVLENYTAINADDEQDFWVNAESGHASFYQVEGETGLFVSFDVGPYKDQSISNEVLASLCYSIQKAFDRTSVDFLNDQLFKKSLLTYVRGEYPWIEDISGEDFQDGDILESWNDRRPFFDNKSFVDKFKALDPFHHWDFISFLIKYEGDIDPAFGIPRELEFRGYELYENFKKVSLRFLEPDAYLARLAKNYLDADHL